MSEKKITVTKICKNIIKKDFKEIGAKVFSHNTLYVSGKKYSFFGKFGVLCLLVTPILRFAPLPYYRRLSYNTNNIPQDHPFSKLHPLIFFNNCVQVYLFVLIPPREETLCLNAFLHTTLTFHFLSKFVILNILAMPIHCITGIHM